MPYQLREEVGWACLRDHGADREEEELGGPSGLLEVWAHPLVLTLPRVLRLPLPRALLRLGQRARLGRRALAPLPWLQEQQPLGWLRVQVQVQELEQPGLVQEREQEPEFVVASLAEEVGPVVS